LTLAVPRHRADDTAGEMILDGASGVEQRDGEGTPMPGVPQPPPGQALLVAFFDDRAAAEDAAAARGGTLAVLPDQDWGEAWKKDLRPVLAGRVHVRPSFIDAPPPPGTVQVVLDPGMAFGTGAHPTTALCLEALSRALPSRPGSSVLDVGTGSGLLAIAARKLGAGRVAACDVDPVAMRVAGENAAANAVALELTAAPVEDIQGSFDLVVANILANTLVELSPHLASRLAPGGLLFLSGILGAQEEEVRAAALAQGLRRREDLERRDGEWSLLALERPS
jgi:ribosomal protein L11 methyltransferase